MAAAFLEPDKYRGTVIPVYDEMLTCDQMVKTFTEVTGIKATCAQCDCPSLSTRHGREHSMPEMCSLVPGMHVTGGWETSCSPASMHLPRFIHACRFQQTTQADLEAYLPPPVAAMLWEAFAYTDQYGYDTMIPCGESCLPKTVSVRSKHGCIGAASMGAGCENTTRAAAGAGSTPQSVTWSWSTRSTRTRCHGRSF